MNPGDKLKYKKRKKRGAKRGYKMITAEGEFVAYQADKVLVRNKHGIVNAVPLYNIIDSTFEIKGDN